MMAIPDPNNQIYDRIPSPFVGRKVSLAEFQALPQQKPPLEYVDGVVQQRPLLHPSASAVRGELTSLLHQFGRERKHGIGLAGVDCLAGETLLVPAISYYRYDTLRARGIESYDVDWGPPDLAAEIVPYQASGLPMLKRCLRYFDLGTSVALVIDVEEELILTLRPGGQPVMLNGDDRIDLDDLLPGFDLTVRALFDQALPEWFWGPRRQADDEAGASERSEG
jgi:Uma2 family endonuclease